MKMQKRILLIFLIALFIAAVIGTAFCEIAVWDCPEYGKTGNTGKFCGGCGHSAPTNENKQDYEAVVKSYMKAAEKGDADAQNRLGYAYDKGHGVEQNYEEAVKWYRKAAEQENAIAQYILGYYYINGIGVEKDEVQGFSWYMKAAEQGDKDAINKIGWCYENGVGVEKNSAEAQRWYEMAK